MQKRDKHTETAQLLMDLFTTEELRQLLQEARASNAQRLQEIQHTVSGAHRLPRKGVKS